MAHNVTSNVFDLMPGSSIRAPRTAYGAPVLWRPPTPEEVEAEKERRRELGAAIRAKARNHEEAVAEGKTRQEIAELTLSDNEYILVPLFPTMDGVLIDVDVPVEFGYDGLRVFYRTNNEHGIRRQLASARADERDDKYYAAWSMFVRGWEGWNFMRFDFERNRWVVFPPPSPEYPESFGHLHFEDGRLLTWLIGEGYRTALRRTLGNSPGG